MPETPQSPAGPDDLTKCEREVWMWIAASKTNWEIGRIIECSKETAKKHVSKVCRKLGVPNRAGAAALYGSYYGLVFPDPTSPVPAAGNPAAPDIHPLVDIWP
jgi:DNA-binding CsgD family transcriptional regulator